MAGCSCNAADNPVVCSYDDTVPFRLGDASKSMDGRWSFASFPNVPCPSPQTLSWEFYEPSVPKWTNVGSSGGSAAVRFIGGQSNNQLANGDTFYFRDVKFFEIGLWRLRTKMACGAAFRSAEELQVVLAAPAVFIT